MVNKAYIISYDLSTPGRNYEALHKKISSYGTWAKLGGSAYVIVTNYTPVQVRDNLATVLDANDKLFVGTLTVPAAWRGYGQEVSNWLTNSLR